MEECILCKRDIRTIAKENFNELLTRVKSVYKVKSIIKNYEIMVELDNGDDIEIHMVDRACTKSTLHIWKKYPSSEGSYRHVDIISDINSIDRLINCLKDLNCMYEAKLYNHHRGWDVEEDHPISWYAGKGVR